MDKLTLQRIETAHPKIKERIRKAYIAASAVLGKGCRLRFSYVIRTFEEQTILFNKRPKITNAKSGQSFHNYGLAFDIVLLYDKNLDGNFEEVSWDMVRDVDKDGLSDWLEVTRIFLAAGFTNGFLSNGKKWDFPHFQDNLGYTWQQLLKKHNAKDFIKGTTFVNI